MQEAEGTPAAAPLSRVPGSAPSRRSSVSTPLGQKESCRLLMAGETEPGKGSGGEDEGTARPSVTLCCWKGFSQGNRVQMLRRGQAAERLENTQSSRMTAATGQTGDRAGGQGCAHPSLFLCRN